MKYKARKLLSLFLAFVMICGTIPAAFASGNDDTGNQGDDTTTEQVDHTTEHTLTYTQGQNGQHTVKCSTKNCKFEEKTENCTYGEAEVTKEATCTEKGSKKSTCTLCKAEKTEEIPAKGHTWGDWTASTADTSKHTHTCTVCKTATESESHDWKYTYKDSAQHTAKCSKCNATKVENHTLNTSTGKCSACQYDSTAIEASITGNRIDKTYDYNDEVRLTANVSVTKGGVEMSASEYDVTYSWSGNCEEASRDESSAWLDTSLAEADAYCTVTVYIGKEKVDSKKLSWHGEVDSEINV